jgi:hypothetical protein
MFICGGRGVSNGQIPSFKFRREPRLEINKTCQRTVGPASFVLVLSVSLFSINILIVMTMSLINPVTGKVYGLQHEKSTVVCLTYYKCTVHVSL